MEAAGSLEDGLALAQPAGQGEDRVPLHHRSRGDRIAADRDLVERRLAADPAAGRGDEMALGHDRGIERPLEANDHGVVGLGQGGRIAELDRGDIRVADQALGPQEADRELGLRAGRAHRDRHGNRLLARSGRPDLHRLLADERVVALLDDVAADRHDPVARDVSGGIGHGRSLRWPRCRTQRNRRS